MSIPRLDTISRQVCFGAGGDTCMEGGGAVTILNTSRNYCHLNSLGHVYQQVARCLQYKCADHPMDRRLLEFDVLRRNAAARAIMGGAFPDGLVSILCMQNAAASWAARSLLRAAVQGSLDLPRAAERMRRLFDPRGGSARRDAPSATDMDRESDEEDLSYDAWAP